MVLGCISLSPIAPRKLHETLHLNKFSLDLINVNNTPPKRLVVGRYWGRKTHVWIGGISELGGVGKEEHQSAERVTDWYSHPDFGLLAAMIETDGRGD
ncbi:hypothetical protein OPQ81_006001 [Rhizoctonia solani]|nr:hypothetical protein OPQ81_006001 [Rhizoctonia solani]